MAKKTVQLVRNNLPKLRAALSALVTNEVLVGVPSDKAERENKDEGPNNATRAYILDNGSPAANIPARPFMKPGIAEARPQVVRILRVSLKDPVTEEVVVRQLNKAGGVAQMSIRNVIAKGIPPALKPATIRARKYARKTQSRRKGEKVYAQLLKEGATAEQAQAATGITPLINTGEMRNSITYVVRRRGHR